MSLPKSNQNILKYPTSLKSPVKDHTATPNLGFFTLDLGLSVGYSY